MQQRKYSQEQIIGLLKQNQAGVPVAQLCREQGVSQSTFFKWKAKYGGLEVKEAKRLNKRLDKRLKQLEDECRRLKQIVADQALDSSPRQRGFEGSAVNKLVKPAAKRQAVEHLMLKLSLSQRWACRLVNITGEYNW